MDGQKFDDIAKSLTTGASRRRVLKGLAAAGVGGALALLGGRRATEAAPCPENRQKCGPLCCPQGFVCTKGGGSPECRPRGQVGR